MRRRVQDGVVRHWGGARRAGNPRWCTVTLLTLTAMLLGAAAASAHTELVSSNPADGTTVRTLPSSVELTFSEPMATSVFVVVAGPAGAQVEVGEPEVTGDTVRQATTGRGPAGDYTLAYRVVSADGHPLSGELNFAVQESSVPKAVAERQGSDEPRAPAETRTSDQATDTSSVGAQSDEGFVSRHAGQLGLAATGLAALAVLVGVGVRGRHTQD